MYARPRVGHLTKPAVKSRIVPRSAHVRGLTDLRTRLAKVSPLLQCARAFGSDEQP